jgi:putative FmdB family regulatory protein
MPTYEYKCECCGIFETKQKMTDPVLQACPQCGATVKRLISPVCVIYKSPGFYITDNRSKSYRESEAENNSQATQKANETKNENTAAS